MVCRIIQQHKLILSSVLFILWIVSVSAALFHLSFTNYGEFDPEFKWLGLHDSINGQQLTLPPSSGLQLVHVLDPSCSCSALAEQHIATLNQQLALDNNQHFYRTAAEVDAAGLPIPALPAVLVFKAGRLLYAGPYASGPQCSAADSFLPALLRGELQIPATWLNGETKACRCLQQQQTP